MFITRYNTMMTSYTDFRYNSINCCGSLPCYSACSIVTHATVSLVHAHKGAYGFSPTFLTYILLHFSHTHSGVGPNLMAMLSRVCPMVGPQVSAYTCSMCCVSCLAVTLSPATLVPMSLLRSL